MNGISSGSLQPTWFGHVATTRDALILFEACLTGTLHHVPRRPHDRERSHLIKSGFVFIYEENASGIKRWTDGVPWSPSRILGNFLVYRELVKPFPPGEKKRAQKRAKNARVSKPGEPYPRRSSGEEQQQQQQQQQPSGATNRQEANFDSRDSERALIGSLVDSYGFKEGGLVKKTMSVNLNGIHHHLVSYYNIEDVLECKLQPPSKDSKLEGISPRPDLIARQNFRASLDDVDLSIQDPLISLPTTFDYGRSPWKSGALFNSQGQQQQSSQMAVGAYSGAASFSTVPQMQSGLQSYAPIGQAPHPFFSPSSGMMPAAVKPVQSFAHFNNSYSGLQTGHLPMTEDSTMQQTNGQAMPYPYRTESITNMASRMSTMGSAASLSDTKSPESADWNRSNTVYSSVTSPLNAQSPFVSDTPQWTMAASMTHSMPTSKTEDGWMPSSVASPWNMSAAQDARHANFRMPSHTG
ncbi:MAG: hypothetical protein LQ340_005216 [Diploschistes diacapsis]|nr:MAG: hypothetical protein LQ340_005216 [Diploschistes diacapsis]